ncbi:MAG TPA: hypothetical protein VJW20_20400 [Candidatus Angelobacter sp.]|nr:hypothetical protein [Candidatus Angelobacter sp.]
MKVPQAFSCDGCGVTRTETDEWRLLRVYKESRSLTYSRSGSLAIYAWDENAANRAGVFHACGRSCVQKLVERYLDGKLAPEKQHAEGATA